MGTCYSVKKIDRPIDWTVEVPGSKSMTNRALLMAALATGETVLEGVLFSDDSRHFLSSLKSLGFSVEIYEEKKQVVVSGCGGDIPAKQGTIDVGSAGTAARFLTAMLGFSDGAYTILASEQMKKRPMRPLFDLLEGIGARITCLEKEGFLPVKIEGCRYGSLGTEKCGKKVEFMVQSSVSGDDRMTEEGCKEKKLYVELDISKSTQFLSALLLISPMIKQGLHIHITSEKTDGAYIRITRNMLEEFGADVSFDGRDYETRPETVYRMGQYIVEPDISAACYFYGAAAVTGGRALVKHVHMDQSQGDLKFLKVLEKMGCTVADTPPGITVTGPAGGRLKGISVNMNDFSDQALTLAAIAPFADSKVEITNIAHIRLQECDRIHAMVSGLSELGILCEAKEDGVTIYPGEPKGGIVETYEDHRVAMSFSLIGLRTEGVKIANPGCCAKTFEEYFTVLSTLTGKDDGR